MIAIKTGKTTNLKILNGKKKNEYRKKSMEIKKNEEG